MDISKKNILELTKSIVMKNRRVWLCLTLIFQGIFCFVLILQTSPFVTECSKISLQEIDGIGAHVSDNYLLTREAVEEVCIQTVSTSSWNSLIFVLGIILTSMLFVYKEEQISSFITHNRFNLLLNGFVCVLVWFLCTGYVLNPLRLSFSYAHSVNWRLIFSPLQLMLYLCLFLLCLPFSLYEKLPIKELASINHSDLVTMAVCPHGVSASELPDATDAIRTINCARSCVVKYQWTIILPIIIFGLDCIILIYMAIDFNQEKREYSDNNNEEYVNNIRNYSDDASEVVTVGKVQELSNNYEEKKQTSKRTILHSSESSQKNDSSTTSPLQHKSKIFDFKQKRDMLNVTALRKSETVANPHQVNLTYAMSENPVILDSPTKPKPVNITKPLAITTSSKPITKRFYLSKETQTEFNLIKDYLCNNKNAKEFLQTFKSENTNTRYQPVTPICSSSYQNIRDDKRKLSVQISEKAVQCKIEKSETSTQIQRTCRANKEVQTLHVASVKRTTYEHGSASPKVDKGVQVFLMDRKPLLVDREIQCTEFTVIPASGEVPKRFDIRENVTGRVIINKKSYTEKKISKYTQTDLYTHNAGVAGRELAVESRYKVDSMDKAVHSITTMSDQVLEQTEPILFKARKSQHGIWYVSLRGDVFLTVSQDVLNKIKSNERNQSSISDESSISDDMLKIMKMFVDNYKKLSNCFDDDDESDDESFINGFRL